MTHSPNPAHPQLAAMEDDLEELRTRVGTMGRTIDERQWEARPAPHRWSPAECIAHLNLTSAAYAPLIRAAIGSAERSERPRRRLRRGVFGGLFARLMEPPVRFQVPTVAALVPTSNLAKRDVLGTFDRLQQDLMQCLRDADGIDPMAVTIVSPISPLVRFNLYGCYSMIAAHQRRHLWQAERAIGRELVALPATP